MIRKGPRRLTHGDYTLREITLDDTERLYDWRAQERIRTMFLSAPPDPAAHARFVEAYFSPQNEDCWFIIEKRDGHAGAVALYRSGPAAQWELGRFVADPAVRGVAGFNLYREATALVMYFAQIVGHERIAGEVLAENRVALAVVTSVGLQPTGEIARGDRRSIEVSADLTSWAWPLGALPVVSDE
jgi:RimJ/RimL family protein N-acetyltransferase